MFDLSNDNLVFTLDLEDWFHAKNIEKYYSNNKRTIPSSLYVIDQILDILDEKKIKGTFFVLGVIGEKYPKTVKKISLRGHEIASHGYNHKLINLMDYKELSNDIMHTNSILSNIIGKKISGYRSPCFSRNYFLEDVLIKEDIKYTSINIKSSGHNRYNYKESLNFKKIYDFPLPIINIFNFTTPITGGGWFRLYPIFLQKKLLKICDHQYKIFYCHPWDFDANQNNLKIKNPLIKIRHTINNKNSFKRLYKLNFLNKTLISLYKENLTF